MTELPSDGPSSMEEAWRERPDRLRPWVRLTDLLVVLGLYLGALLFLYPLAPHFEVSSDSMDPFSHAWGIWTGRVGPLSSHNLLYAYGRAWTHLPLLLGAHSMEGVAHGKALIAALVPVCVYLAGRILLGGTSPGVEGHPARRAGAVLAPLLGALLLVRMPGYLWSQVAGSHVYFAGEWSALALVPAAVLLRWVGLGGGDGETPVLPSRRVAILAAVALTVSLGFSPLNHPYGLAATAVIAPLGLLLGLRRGRAGWTLFGGVLLGLALLGAPHVVTLVLSGRGAGLVDYARSDAEFGVLPWGTSLSRLFVERTESRPAWALWVGLWTCLGAGLLALRSRPRLAGATLSVFALALTAGVGELLMTRVSHHIQPYHWRPLMPWFALCVAMTLAVAMDRSFRRSQRERIVDAERGRGLSRVLLRRLPLLALCLFLLAEVLQICWRSLSEERGYLDQLWSISVPRQGWHHDRVTRRMLQRAEPSGRLPVLAGVDYPEFSIALDPIAMAFETHFAGRPLEEYAREPGLDEPILFNIGLVGTEVDPILEALIPGMRLVQGDEDHLLLEATPRVLRGWTARLCDGRPGPAHFAQEPLGTSYRLRGSQEMRHLTVRGELHFEPYLWAHPCTGPFAWPDIVLGEYPLLPTPGTDVTALGSSGYKWATMGPLRVSRTETTRKEWAACVGDEACRPGPEAGDAGMPVTGVSPEDALRYCRWLADAVPSEGLLWSGDLPNQAEWEVLASYRRNMMDHRSRYPWGDEAKEGVANAAIPGGAGAVRPVGSFPAGRAPLGLEDAAGNVAEWVRRASLPPDDEGRWGQSEPGFLLAGGSFRSSLAELVVGATEDPAPDRLLDDVGFRCVLRGAPEGDP